MNTRQIQIFFWSGKEVDEGNGDTKPVFIFGGVLRPFLCLITYLVPSWRRVPIVVGEMLDWWRFYLLQDIVTLLVNIHTALFRIITANLY